ncbi:MAG: hypothetical protein JW750_03225 [Anaerolineaceae bacterium]|nr:hypothetical protein [Anaerolineaceae bacterium]
MMQSSTQSPGLSTGARYVFGILLSAVSALLLALAMPPYGIWPLAVIGFLPMIIAQYRVLPARHSSLANAITISGLVALYIMPAFLQLPNAPWFMRALPLFFALIVFLTGLGNRAFQERTGYRYFILSGALGWVGVEMIRSLIPVLGTWGFIAYSYFKSPWLIQPVSIFGIFGMSLINMLLSYGTGLFLMAWFDRKWRLDPDARSVPLPLARRSLLAVSIAFSAWLLLSLVLLKTTPTTDTIRVAAVQPDFKGLWTEAEKEQNWLTAERWTEVFDTMQERMFDQSREAAARGARFIVWPEGGLIVDPQRSLLTPRLEDLAEKTQAYLAIAYGIDQLNEVAILSPEGEFLGKYGKNHPVSFVHEPSASAGEYPSFESALGPIGTIICYDSDFTDTARNVAKSGANLLAVPSGDWPAIADRHYAHSVFRAVENRVAIVKTDRSYDSAIVDAFGRIQALVMEKSGSQATLVADVSVVKTRPPQTHLGDWIGWIALAGMAFFTAFDPITKNKQKKR